MERFHRVTQAAELSAYQTSHAGCVTKFSGPWADVFSAEEFYKPQPAPSCVTPRQIRLALTQAGLRSVVEQAVAGGSQDLKDWWEYALEIERNNSLVVGMAQQLGITEQQLDDLFRLAATL